MAEMGGGEEYATCFYFEDHDAEIQCGFSIVLVSGKWFLRAGNAALAELLRFNFNTEACRGSQHYKRCPEVWCWAVDRTKTPR
jgi:hypothetical protein